MKRFKIEQSNEDIISHGGLSLIGQAIKHYANNMCSTNQIFEGVLEIIGEVNPVSDIHIKTL